MTSRIDHEGIDIDSREGFDAQAEAEYNAYLDACDDSFACAECGEEVANGEICDCELEPYEDEFDGQPTEYEEWQDFYGGDDWDHGQYDEY
jgi:hypothetical protein